LGVTEHEHPPRHLVLGVGHRCGRQQTEATLAEVGHGEIYGHVLIFEVCLLQRATRFRRVVGLWNVFRGVESHSDISATSVSGNSLRVVMLIRLFIVVLLPPDSPTVAIT
jgi:hypothetical protein